MPRQRRTAGGSTSASKTKSTGSGSGWGYSGKSVTNKAKEAQKASEAKRSSGGDSRAPLRFYMKKGEECEIIILDNSMEDGFAFYEHNLKGPDGRWGHLVPCIKDFDTCPICKEHGDSSYVLFLSVIVCKSFTTKAGKEIPHSKMLLPVKITQFDMFRELEESAIEEGGSLRGMSLVMRRGTDTTASRIGEPIPVKGRVYDLLDEDTLEEEFGHDVVKGDDGKVFRPANYDITPYDYSKVFPMPDVDAIKEEYGVGPTAGSARDVLNELDEEDEDYEEEEAEEEKPTSRRRGASKEEEEEEEAPTRSRSRKRASDSDDKAPF